MREAAGDHGGGERTATITFTDEGVPVVDIDGSPSFSSWSECPLFGT